jgi:hypothetical protein
MIRPMTAEKQSELLSPMHRAPLDHKFLGTQPLSEEDRALGVEAMRAWSRRARGFRLISVLGRNTRVSEAEALVTLQRPSAPG